MNDELLPNRTLRRQLILRDSLVFFTLSCITLLLFVATLFLFRSFTAHRAELGRRWYARGQRDLAAAHATDAIFDLRAATDYAPSDTDYQFVLAEALKSAGKTEEATTYFNELRDSDPGNGPLNLELARLSVQKKDAANALHYYRAAIYGAWDDNPVGNRRAARLELSHNLLAAGDRNTARTELLIASEDTDDDTASQTKIASMMMEAVDDASALTLFQKTLGRAPQDTVSLEGAGNAAFNLGHYASAARYLKQASDLSLNSAQRLADAIRLLGLFPASDLPKAERALRIQRIAAMTQTQLIACQLQSGDPNATAQLTSLDEAWKATSKSIPPARLRDDAAAQNAELQLAHTTLEQTQQFCKASADSLLLRNLFTHQETILQ